MFEERGHGAFPLMTEVTSIHAPKIMKRNYKLTVSYDGSRYYGWEHQKSTPLTIQGKLEAVLTEMTGTAADVTGAGRTDAGVHAKAMTASVQLDTELSEEEIRDYLNRYLPDDIGVTDVRIAAERFHARYSAVGKTYCYSCWVGENKPVFERKYLLVLEKTPDLARMQEAAALLTGTHDYKSFCGNPRMKKSTVRTVDSIEIRKQGPYLRFYYHGNGLLQHMVRIMTGTLLEVGFGKRAPGEIPEILAAADRTAAGYTAPAQGLCLISVDYN